VDQQLTTERLMLRRFEPDDAQRLVEPDSDPAVLRWTNGGVPTPRSVIESRILPLFCTYDEQLPLHGFWAAQACAAQPSTDGFLGWFAFRATEDGPHHVSLGFRLIRADWLSLGGIRDAGQAL
jgi:RimJ/RimL family protein N-acetyltransferase